MYNFIECIECGESFNLPTGVPCPRCNADTRVVVSSEIDVFDLLEEGESLGLLVEEILLFW